MMLEKNKNALIVAILIVYCIMTIAPFYILLVRAFTPTQHAMEFHWLFPPRTQVNMDAPLGGLSTNYNIDIREFRRALEIKGYVNPNLTLNQIAEQFEVDRDEVLAYMRPLIEFNGLMVALNSGFLKSPWQTIIVAGVSVVVGGFLGIMTGTALAGFRQRWQLWVYNTYLFNLVIPPMLVILPQYLIMVNLFNLHDSLLPIILLHIKGGALSTMVFTNYIASIPKEMRESVEMDGGKHYHYFLYIILPLMATPFSIFASIQLPHFWNDLLHPLVFLSASNYTLPAFISVIGGTYTTNFEAIYAGVLMSLLPILVVYMVFQKMFVRSAMAGALKG